ncbi:hypothetical protein MKW98_010475 [Papaver atlanticum]|uniref:PAS domain-containing protein n=1 Tax=Papaver atlanticum TaxID=357466 RepID=A0AAD4TAX4_9MAGN|nr:hypothetical protein MKW98_010475 [Papaver atlanticum]
MDDIPLQEHLLKKIQELDVEDANLREEMAKLTCYGASCIGVDFGIKNIDCSNQSPLDSVQRPGPTSSCREIGWGHDETVPIWKIGSGSSKHIKRSILDSYNILQSIGQAIHIVDDKNLIIYWSRTAEGLYGYSASEAIGRNSLHLIVDETFMGESWTGVFPVINKQGRRFRVIVTNSPFYYDCGTLVGFLCVTCDSHPFHETQTTFTSTRNLSKEAACRQPSKSCAPATTGLNSQQKPLQVTIPSKLLNMTSRMAKFVRSATITREKAIKYDIQGGKKAVIAAVGFMDQQLEIPEDTDPQWASLIKTCLHSDSKCRPTFGELFERLDVIRRYYFAEKA